MKNQSNEAGKGDSPRSNYSKQFRDNYDQINWGKSRIIDDGRLEELDLKVTKNNLKYATSGPKSSARKKKRPKNVLDEIRFGEDEEEYVERTKKIMEALLDGYSGDLR